MAQQSPVILITGGAQGIGKGIAAHFLDKMSVPGRLMRRLNHNLCLPLIMSNTRVGV